jgi:ABC-type sulfate transport system permease component
MRLSLQTASIATVVCVALGVPLAWLLARVEFPGRRLVRALVTVPLVLPPVVGGVALLLVFGRNGLVGSWLESTFGISLPFTTAGVVVAQAFVAMPPSSSPSRRAPRRHRYEDAPPRSGPAAGRSSAASPSPTLPPPSSPERCCAGHEPSASSGLP